MRFWDRACDAPIYCPERIARLCREVASGLSMNSILNHKIIDSFLDMARTFTSEDFKAWGAQGGAKSKRVLTAAQAKAMVAAREKKRRKTQRVTRRANNRPTEDART